MYCLVEILINAHTAKRVITDVLLDGRILPATERSPATPARILIPIAPPETHAAPSIPITHKARPLIVVGVDTTKLAAKGILCSVSKIVHEITVAFSVSEPVFRALNIKPHLTVLDVASKVVKRLYLTCSITTLRAREHVDINILHTTIPSIGNAGRAVGIRITSAAEATDDGKFITVVSKALPGTDTIKLGNINTNSSTAYSKASSKSNKSKRKTHFHKTTQKKIKKDSLTQENN